MKSIPDKVNTALTSIDTALSSLMDRKKKGNPVGAFIIYDTLFTFQGAISRAVDKGSYELFVAALRQTLEYYAYYIDNPVDERLSDLETTIHRTRRLIFDMK